MILILILCKKNVCIYHMFGNRHTKQIIKIDRSLTKEVKSMENKVEELEGELTNVLTSADSNNAQQQEQTNQLITNENNTETNENTEN